MDHQKEIIHYWSKCTPFKHCIFTISFCVIKCCIGTPYCFFIYLCSSYPYEMSALWCILLHLILSSDVHPNPGPMKPSNNFYGGFLSFCNWNLNTLSKENFYRISLLEADNVSYNYDIISLCETTILDKIYWNNINLTEKHLLEPPSLLFKVELSGKTLYGGWITLSLL